MTDWPAWATEDVHVADPDPSWQARGADLARELDAALAPWLVRAVEHVGSTSVPGLPAKPVLDLQAAVTDLACAPDVADVLSPAGWHHVPPELDERPWRRFFVLAPGDTRVAHLHLMPPDEPRWGEQLAFRDALRADPGLAARYAALKRELAVQHASDREAYTAAKEGFVREVLGR